MRLSTLCYIERDGCYLMLHRVKKHVDANAGKWIGVGGGLEKDESPDECIAREVMEETGLTLISPRLRGIITFILPEWENEITFLYTAGAAGTLRDTCSEGELQWIPLSDIDALNLWEGDRVFLKLLRETNDVFSLKLAYQGDKLMQCALNGNDITKETLGECP